MVFPGGEAVAEQRLHEVLSIAKISPVRQSRFHNFTFPTMNWGSHQIVRRVGVSRISGSPNLSMINPDTQIKSQTEKKNASFTPLIRIPNEPKENVATEQVSKPWNLRKRKAGNYASLHNGMSSPTTNPPLGKVDTGKAVKGESVIGGENCRRRKFSISLTRQEIEEDFYLFTGMKPSKRPKKRPMAVQKKLNDLYPGFWLKEITENSYKLK